MISNSSNKIPTFLGLSGGVDSCVLLHMLVAKGITPTLLHFNHGIRAESTAEEAFVRELALKYKLPIIVGHNSDPAKRSENDLRQARWSFFRSYLPTKTDAQLFLAHHADDQVETMLLQLSRGVGTGSLGMKESSRQDNILVQRPLLSFQKEDLITYAQQHQLRWCEDQSNLDTTYRRNLLRHEVLPILRKLNPSMALHFSSYASKSQEDAKFIDSCLPEIIEQPSTKTLKSLAPPLLRRYILLWLRKQQIDASERLIEDIVKLCCETSPAKVNAPENTFIRRTKNILYVEKTVEPPSL